MVTRDLLFYDAAFPPQPPPTGFDGVAFYVGGDTPHVWSVAEIQAQPVRFRLPIFTRSNPPGPGVASDVAAAVTRLREIGAPKGCLVAWDSETSVDPAYIKAVYFALKAEGYTLIDYGSMPGVFGNDNPDGYYWGAQWTNVPHIAPGDVMTQWRSLSSYDESSSQPVLPFWDTQKEVNMTELPGEWLYITNVDYLQAGEVRVTGVGGPEALLGNAVILFTTWRPAAQAWDKPTTVAPFKVIQ